MKEISCKLLVIGAGPGGYVCAIRAGQLGVDTVIVEANALGGTCLNIGCIPSKALIHAADEFAKISRMAAGESPLGISVGRPEIELAKTVAWKDGIVGRLTSGVSGLLKRSRVKIVKGVAKFRDGKTVVVESETGTQIIRAEAIVIATGSAPVALPALPFGGAVISSTAALALGEGPRSLVVVGAGEAEPTILPQCDAELTRPVARRLDALGVKVLVGAKAKGLTAKADALLVET